MAGRDTRLVVWRDMNVDVPAGDVARLRQQLATAVVRNDDYIVVLPEEVRTSGNNQMRDSDPSL